MKLKQSSVILLLSLWLLLASVLPSSAAGDAEAPSALPDVSEARAVYFYHMESERLLGAKDADKVYPAGSTVKLLAGLLACERLGGMLSEPIVIQEEMIAASKGYRYQLAAGESYTVDQLLCLALCGSYNDAYDVLAYLLGNGDPMLFVAAMNQRAAELGALHTVAGDPTGIKDNSQTTAEDLFRIAKAAAENPLYMRLTGSMTFDLPDGRIYNRNALISKKDYSQYYNPLCQGMTAGSTASGGASVVTVAQKGNDRYLCVVLGANEVDGGEVYSYVVANRLIEWGFDTYTYLEVLTPDTPLCTIPVTASDMTEEVEVKAAETLSLFLPAGAKVGEDVTFSLRLMYEELEAPVTEGLLVGYVAVVYGGDILATAPLYTAGTADRGSVISGLLQIRSLTESRRVRAGLIFFLVVTVGWLLTEYILLRRRRHKWDKYFSSKIDLPETLMKQEPRKTTQKK